MSDYSSENNNDVDIHIIKGKKEDQNKIIQDDKMSDNSSGKVIKKTSKEKKSKKKKKLKKSISNEDSLEVLKANLEEVSEMIVKQEADILEAVTGCQEPNNYHVYGKLPNGEKIYVFKCREFSGCFMRFCCPVDCRAFVMKIKLAFEEENENEEEEEFEDSIFQIRKEFACPCLCCFRPEMLIILTENEVKLGIIKFAFSCCNPIFIIYDKENKARFHIEAECCQCGLVCRNNFLGKTDEVHFFIYNINDKSNPIGDICKKAAKSVFSVADNYSVILPQQVSFEDKILLTIAGIMVDYQYFEKNTGSK